jgi:peptide/nickel transport system substrate-binding protein
MARTPTTGRLRLALPWGLGQLDPHDPNDPAAAFFGQAIAEPLFAKDPSGRPYPALAADWPKLVGDRSVVTLRSGLRSSVGRAIDTTDLLWSMQRATNLGARALLGPFGAVRAEPDAAPSVSFPTTNPSALAEALCSPLTVLLPRAFSPKRPVGTGPFEAKLSAGRLLLERNTFAARGAAFLQRIEVESTADLGEALRSFEAAEVDVGWLGRGLHSPRRDTKLVDAGAVGWVVLHSGKDAGSWGAPGVAAQLLSSIPRAQLERFGLGVGGRPPRQTPYGGPPCELLVDAGANYLIELGKTLCDLLSRPGHEVSLTPLERRALQQRKRAKDFAFLLDLTRSLGDSSTERQLSLLQESDPALARRPPQLPARITEAELLERVTATLNLAVVGTLRVIVALAPTAHGLEQWQLGDAWLAPS